MKKKRGFTLVELMVVLTVIALLLSVVVPDYVGRMKRAEEAVLQENLA
jgi:general secretion pathway protein G